MPPTDPRSSQVVELRQYTLHPGRRDELIDLFDRHFVETQEEVGIRVLGQFRDLDAADRFVWLRGFAGMAERGEALPAFYERHPAWQEHGLAAAATMIDSDDVLLLAPVTAGSALLGGSAARPPVGSSAIPPSVVEVAVHHLPGRVELCEFEEFFEQEVLPVLTAAGAPPLACFRTDPSENNFPRLPVRTGENAFVRLSVFRDSGEHRDHRARLEARADWTQAILPSLTKRLARPLEQLRLAPTARSVLR